MSTVCRCADSMQIPPSPLSVADVDSEQVAQKQGSLDVNGFPRITGLSTEQHTFTADIAFSQVPAASGACLSAWWHHLLHTTHCRRPPECHRPNHTAALAFPADTAFLLPRECHMLRRPGAAIEPFLIRPFKQHHAC